MFEGTVSTISSDPPCKEGFIQFTTVPLKALSDEVKIKYLCFLFGKLISISFQLWVKSDLRISTAGTQLRIIRIKPLQTYKNNNIFLIIDQRKGSRVPLYITRTVPLVLYKLRIENITCPLLFFLFSSWI